MFEKLRKWLRDLAGLDDPPQKIARGLALGIFVGFLPIMGIQMGVVLPFALVFRGNKTAAIGGVWITNPITVIPIYYLNYCVGLLFTPYESMEWAYFENLFTDISAAKFFQLGGNILIPLAVGGLILGVVLGTATYFWTLRFVIRYRAKREREREEREQRRLARRARRAERKAAKAGHKATKAELKAEKAGLKAEEAERKAEEVKRMKELDP